MKNKTGKYVKYAIGEIILVMIGILLALQVNNWNENNKAEDYEKNILLEINRTLEKDLEDFKFFEERIIKKDTAIDNLLFARSGEKTFTENQLIDNIYWVNSSIVFSYNKGPYETLKSIGLDKIKSDTLRYTLTNHYDVILPRFTSFFEIAHKRHEPKINELIEVLEKKEFFKKGFELSKKREGFYPKTDHDVNKYLNEDIYYNLLVLQASYKLELWTDIKSIIRLTEETKKAVELEIEERFKN